MATFRHEPSGRRFLFIHIPRTAGRFIETNLMMKNAFLWDDDYKKLGISKMYDSIENVEFGHFHREYYEKYLNVKGIPHITIIRNPIDRFISASLYINRMYGSCQELMEDEHYFYSMLENFPLTESISWYRPQLDYLTNKTHIWRFEDGFGKDFIHWLRDIIGIDQLKFDENIKYNTSADEGYKLKRTPKLMNNIRHLYRKDIEQFYPDAHM